MRESSGSTYIEAALRKALKVLKLCGIPHYPRFTVDVGIIVPDVGFVYEKLSLNGLNDNDAHGP